MKIPVFDVSHIINQIKCASPPSDRAMHKLLNNLSILLEKNTIKKSSNLEANLSSSIEKLNDTFIDLCFLRKEIVTKFNLEYYKIIEKALLQIKKNKEKIEEKEKNRDLIKWEFKNVCGSKNLIEGIFSKLNKAKGIIEDALEKNSTVENNIDAHIESFFTNF